VNGTTYTQSGTYTSVTGCSTETLVLTITPSTNNTTTVSECDSVHLGCERNHLHRERYLHQCGGLRYGDLGADDPAEREQHHHAERVRQLHLERERNHLHPERYLHERDRCSTETLVLTITPSTNNTTTVSECDSYTWA
jgi:hypothetical protein